MEKIISTFRIVINRFSFPCNFQKIRRTRSKFLSIILNLIFENFINKKKKKRSPQFSAAKNKLDKVDKHGDREIGEKTWDAVGVKITRKYEMVSRLRISPRWNQA